MNGHALKCPRWLASPLTGTVVVFGCLAVIAVPLSRLTSGAAVVVPAGVPQSVPVEAGRVPAVVRVKLLDPADRLEIVSADGAGLLRLDAPAAGESEHDIVVPSDAGVIELQVRVACGSDETAVFVTLMPDGREEQTRYLTGAGDLEDTLRFEWPHP